jgi:transaldolase/glucose-6-phosphate isomerase
MKAQRQVADRNRFDCLRDQGQAVWLDFLSRRFINEGGLQKLIDQDGLTGVTSNPAIFEKAIGESEDYDASLKQMVRQSDLGVMGLYEHLAIEDIRRAADVLRHVYEKTRGDDGYVSLEVSPYLAMDTEATVAEACRLWESVGRDNIMIKVPATKPGLPAIRRLIGRGIKVNITLLFSQRVYDEVVEAYLAGLEDYIAHQGDPRRIASVASFFVSRIDVAVDKLIEDKIDQANDARRRQALSALRGKVAIANAKLAYRRYKRLFAGPRWEKLRAEGARPQRLLWASTGTKNPKYSDVLYVEELVGPDTVNTMPPATMRAFRDHGKVRASLEENIEEAEQIMERLSDRGISIDEVTAKLTEDGVELFDDAFDKLLGAVARKRAAQLGDVLNQQTVSLPPKLKDAVASSLNEWRRSGKVRRLWAGDATLWSDSGENKWVGWLHVVKEQCQRLDALKSLAKNICQRDLSHIVLLGMGGSSLGPEVLAETFGRQRGHPELLVLDSTDPLEIRTIEGVIELDRTLFIVASKSGTTLEPNLLKRYFFEQIKKRVSPDRAGSQFIAITDRGSKLQSVAEQDGFEFVAFGKPSIGGRYSVLSDFGMVPATLMGLDVGRLLQATQKLVRSCGPEVPPTENPGVALGTVMAVAANSGRDKITVIASPGLASFGAWLEQLLAESTGKQEKGLIPIDGEPLGPPEVYGPDRLFVYLRLMPEPDQAQDVAIAALEQMGHPIVRITVADRYHIGQEFFRWEIATAVAGAILGINPFNQPDVEASKIRARELTDAYEATGLLPAETPIWQEGGMKIFADEANAKVLKQTADGTFQGFLKAYLGRLRPGDYCALLAYVARNERHQSTLQEIRKIIRDAKGVATCVGFGPRFLHSTGQLYKGGPNSGVFLEITYQARENVAIPGHKCGFAQVIAAQALGDFVVLSERARRALCINLGTDPDAGLMTLKETIRQAVT